VYELATGAEAGGAGLAFSFERSAGRRYLMGFLVWIRNVVSRAEARFRIS
jgi:hypothetical protein